MHRGAHNQMEAVAMLALACAPVGSSSVAAAQAAPTTGVLQVTARIESGCRVAGQSQATGVDFGELDFAAHPSLFRQPLTARSQLSMGTLRLQCVGVLSANVSIGVGMHATGSQRRLMSGTHHVPYDLYADSAGLEPFAGNTPRGVAISATGALAVVDLPVFGRVPATVGGYSPGNYQDSVQVTVSW
ncbi:spore coat U domain-containing protein [Steroidobacter sp.]|uniref:Csu type fimbrial protein n=1 Tax=Steroidobacter sp. TaxID=1978227 RepID=UPI001A4CCE3C|nr:spore coat U domain-containing protein [Steroidobacter sp.]MBL8267221.1 spore coat U domain-containing protein [Steroidobacter sp.]